MERTNRASAWRGPLIGIGALALAALIVGIEVVVGIRAASPPHAAAFKGTPVSPPRSAPNATLVDQDGRPAPIVASGDAATFVFFGYTHCPDECPLAMAHLGAAYRRLPPGARVRVVFVTVDPARDTPAVVGRYVRAFDPHFVGLTGDAKTLARVWQAWGVAVIPQTREIAHGGDISLLDAHGNVVLEYPSDAPAADLAADATALAR